VHIRQRTLRDNRFTQRCHARGLSVYLGFYLSNYHNLSTPLKVWNDEAGWSQIVVPTVRGIAGAAKLLGMDGIATDSENYHTEDQTWNWNYPGVTQSESTVRALARQRGREWMTAVLAGFPNVEIINYRLEIPGDWEEKVQQQVNHVVGIWDKSVFPDFWNGIVDTEGFSAIHFFDPIFYKSWQVGSGWDAALDYNRNGVRATLSKRWANWNYASSRFFISPFAWIDPGPSAGSFDDARPVDYVAAQLAAFHKWGEGNMFGLYAQHVNDFDYGPYVPALQAASKPDSVQSISPSGVTQVGGSLIGGSLIEVPGGGLTAASLRLETVADGLREPTDSAFSPDGRMFITERTGGIRILRGGNLNTRPAITLTDLWTQGGNGLLAIALDPQFDRTHFVYVLYTAAARSGAPVFRLARFLETADALQQRAILLDGVPAARAGAAASLRFGPDGKLYAAFDAGADPDRMGDLASYNGKIVRLNRDGTTPSDQLIASPVFGYGFRAPLGFDWQPGTNTLWAAGRDLQDVGRLRAVARDDIRSLRSPEEDASYVLPHATSASTMAFYRGDLIPALRGNLLVAGGDVPAIMQIAFENASPAGIKSAAPLLENAGGVVRTLVVSPDGAIYFCVDSKVVRLVTRYP
jgi:glucose/arabinose dehydrogenase